MLPNLNRAIRRLIAVLLPVFVLPLSGQQIGIERVTLMPNQPAPYLMRDWKTVTKLYDQFVFDFAKQDSNGWLPLIEKVGSGVNYPSLEQFWLHTVVGTTSPSNGEAINVLPAVVGASLVGIDKSNHNGQNWVLLCQQWFNRRAEENVYLNNFNGGSGNDWWYDTMPNVFFYQLYDLYPGIGDFEYQFSSVADRWLAAVEAMGGQTTPWENPYMNYRGWYLSTMTPNTDTPAEPEAAGAIAWLLYNAYQKTGENRYRIGAEWCMEFLNQWPSNPSYELQLPYGAYTAARMNAEIGTRYNVEKLLNWCFTTEDNVRQWGVTLGQWGAYDCYGLVGEAQNDGYAFLMNGFEMAGALVPMVRYDDRFARTIGKWVLNLANASRLFYTAYLPDDHQDSEAWSYQYDPQSVIAHEAMRETFYGKSPYATGDAVSGGWGKTNLALYGSSHVGILGGIIDTTATPMILQLDLGKTDYFQPAAYPSYLYYNPYDHEKTVTLNLSNGGSDVYDAVSNTFLIHNASGAAQITLPPDNAVIAVVTPANGEIDYHLDRMSVNGIAVDFNTERSAENYPPRIKSLSPSNNKLTLNDTITVYCTAADLDGNPLQYEWQSTSGVFLDEGAQVRWLAPGAAGEASISCRVRDGNGGADSSAITITVVESINHAPQIDSLKAFPRKIDLGGSSRFNCKANDADGDTLNYTWQATGGALADSGRIATWIAPTVEGTYTIACTVDDGKGATVSDHLDILVRDFSQYEEGRLTAYYPLDGNAEDAGNHGFDGEVHGATPVNSYDEIPNNAYMFDGINDRIRIPNHDALNFREAITINFWLKIPSYLDREAFILSHGSWQNRWKISITPKPDNRLRWTVNTENGIRDIDTEFSLKKNIWYHITAFYDGRDFELYVDGKLNNFTGFSGKLKTTTYDLLIGQMLPNDFNYNLKGTVDEVRIFENGLAPTEIQAIYDEMTPLNENPSTKTAHQFYLAQNYPNPFNAETTIIFTLDKRSRVTLRIFDLEGRLIDTLTNQVFSPGRHVVHWNVKNEASGLYLYNIKSKRHSATKKMILLK